MVRLVLTLASATGLVGVTLAWAQGERSVDLSAYDARNADLEAGRAIVVGAYSLGPGGACFQCHGMEGKGDAAAAFPRLTGQVYKYLYDSMKDYASGARQNAVMTPIAQALSGEQMRNVSAYYAAQSIGSPEPGPQADPAQLQYGAGIAAVGHAERGVQGCINCHGPGGAGLPPTYPYLAGQYASYLEAQMRAWKSGERKSDRLSAIVMEGISKRLTDEDIRAVSLYYASIRPQVVTPERAEAANPMVPSPGASTRPLGR